MDAAQAAGHIRRLEGGILSGYMHLSDFVVQAGDEVAAGQLVGHVGKSGVKQSGAHLHFELRRDGKHTDPLPCYPGVFSAPEATYRGNLEIKEERRVRRKRRIRAREARKAESAANAGHSVN